MTTWVRKIIEDGINQEEIGIFVRSNNELLRAREVVKLAEQTPLEISNRVEDRGWPYLHRHHAPGKRTGIPGRCSDGLRR